MPSVVPAFMAALYAGARAALPAEVQVLDGDTVIDTSDDFVMIGVGDVDSENRTTAATSRQEWANANYTARDETGQVLCAASSFNGDGDIPKARVDTFALMAAIETMLHNTPAMGVEGLLWSGVGDFDYDQWQSQSGAAGLLIFRIDYRARI
ncbi:hypothetical protein L2K70_04735 [Nocardioides KLBMP 9356]|uniref:DUF3168 domain-containing protein n=1 Tax=Nocardioides potassii TaxID=2911371 RepID=A0ABS9H6P9_9ACTN|nr:hypothetical protein [Nocardioides potassii]MCF6376901.1 hypothetical protein [Nocardioides potassii]